MVGAVLARGLGRRGIEDVGDLDGDLGERRAIDGRVVEGDAADRDRFQQTLAVGLTDSAGALCVVGADDALVVDARGLVELADRDVVVVALDTAAVAAADGGVVVDVGAGEV